MTAIDIDGLFRHTPARTAIGAENLTSPPAPKGQGPADRRRGGQRVGHGQPSRAKEAPGAA